MINKQYFSKEQVRDLKFHGFLDALIEDYGDCETTYNDIHIIPHADGGLIIEWVQVTDDEYVYDGSFQFVSADQTVVTEYKLPDNSYVQFATKEEFDEYFEQWQKDNPGWVKTSYGTWTNEIENQKFREEFNLE